MIGHDGLMMGIDIGGSGIKGAPVDLDKGQFAELRHRVETPQPATPKAVLRAVGEVMAYFKWAGPIGCTFPAVVQDGKIVTAANVDSSWIGTDAAGLLSHELGHEVLMVNDADAAGVAEMAFGAGHGQNGTVLIITLGTGIGTSLFSDGNLVPNTELGHIEIDGVDAETRAASRWRKEHNLTWPQWAARVDQYLCAVEQLIWPELIIIGGGVSKRHDKFFPYLHTHTAVVPAQLRNDAGIIGAALLAAENS